MTTTVRVKIPERVVRGETFTIKTLVRHRMESGHRVDETGEPIPEDILERFVATFEGREVFAVELGTGIAANPFLQFTARVGGPGTFVFRWSDGAGLELVHEETVAPV